MGNPIFIPAPRRGEDFLWQLEEVGPGVRKKFSAMCAAIARQDLYEQRSYLSVDAYRDAQTALASDIAAGAYRWGTPFEKDAMGPALLAIIREPSGWVRLLHALLEKKHPDVTLDDAAKVIEHNAEAAANAIREAMGHPPNSETPPTTQQTAGDQSATATEPKTTTT